MPDDERSGDPLTGLESLMWRLGSAPGLSATFGSISILDGVPDRDRFERRVAAAVRAVPRLRRTVARPPVPGVPPTWVDDDEPDLTLHLRWVALDGGDVDEHALLDRAARRVAEPFDPAHPLWDIEILTGLPDGRSALVQRMHHVVSDGIGGIRLSEHYLDVEPDAPDPTPDPFVGDPPPAGTWLERAVVRGSERATGAARTLAAAGRWAVEGVADPGRFGAAGTAAVQAIDSMRRQLVQGGPPRSSLWSSRSDRRRLVATSTPFGPMRDAATRSGASVNALFVTAVLRAAASYHRHEGTPLDDLRVAVPVSTRADGRAAGNAFAPVRLVLPAGGDLAAAAHLRQVADALGAAVSEPSVSLMGRLAGLAELAPTAVLGEVVRRQAAATDVVCSNVRAAPFPLYVSGARIVSTHALGPLVGTPVNVTMMTYDGRVDLGIHVDTEAIVRPELLRDAIVGALQEVVSAV